MKKAVPVLLALAGLPSLSPAVENTRIDWQVSADFFNWSSELTVQQGQRLWVRAVVSYTGTQTPVGLAGFVFQPTVSNWDAAGGSEDIATVWTLGEASCGWLPPCYERYGRYSPFDRSPITLTGFVHTNGSGCAPPGSWLRIAQASATNWFGCGGNTTGGSGVPVAQLSDVGRTTSDPLFETTLQNIPVYRFGILLSTDIVARTLTIDSPVEGFGNRNTTTGERQVYWFASTAEATGSIRGAPFVVPAIVHVQPCGSADFNNDGDSGTDADIEAFFACIGGSCCASCGSADFNGDGDAGTDADIEAFFRVLAGGLC
jgi:hypothetical protein